MPPSRFDYSDYDRTVVGYHGTSAERAERLVGGEAFKASNRDNEWFGDGVYFWEYAPKQALRWAKAVRKFDRPAVVGALIRLGNCLDLLDPVNVKTLKEFKSLLMERFQAAGVEVPQNHRRHKKLDCAVFNLLYAESDAAGTPIDSARAVYVPADSRKRIWEGSWIHDDAHVQVCVRNPRNVLAVWHVRHDGRYGRPAPKATGEG